MALPIEVGCMAEIRGAKSVPDGTLVQVVFPSHEEEGMPTWVISEQFKNKDGLMSDRCFEHLLHRVDDDNSKELCTDWADVMLTTGWVPDEILEAVEI